ncbi:MAG TPA: ribonuclease H-like domain-containing protein [Nannocystaceae bacterium]|nr:ribonuclease H-like domain-containing protein [Nannocystaceae bacterium]
MSLRERLAARAGGPIAVAPPGEPAPAMPPWGRCIVQRIPGDAAARTGAVARVFADVALPSAAEALAGLEALVDRDRRALATAPPIVFDLETTGWLEAIPWIVGIGVIDDDAVEVHQLVLDHPSRERAMWSEALAILRRLGLGRAPIVTYNGASFDRPIVAMRLRRLGLWSDALARAFGPLHVDLLPVARRLWRHRWHDRRLVHLESALLHARRVGDVAGADVAAIGRRWLEGARSPMDVAASDRVVVHNALDLVGLAALFGRAVATCRAPGDAAQAVAVAHHLQRIGRDDAARHVLAEIVGGDPLATPAIEAALALAEIERAAGRIELACVLWSRVCAAVPDHARAIEALAKAYEHRLRAPDVALAWAERAPSPCPRRLARLRQKLARVTRRATRGVGAAVV